MSFKVFRVMKSRVAFAADVRPIILVMPLYVLSGQ
jgi:hypothetical protein